MIWLVTVVGLGLSLAALLLIRQQLEAHKLLDFDRCSNTKTGCIPCQLWAG
ncbi:MAG: hypothetical protein U9Q71_01530 [Pseudomonadota bacterium]|nr:hypothetical protein [Pseudomonadota bacterium]